MESTTKNLLAIQNDKHVDVEFEIPTDCIGFQDSKINVFPQCQKCGALLTTKSLCPICEQQHNIAPVALHEDGVYLYEQEVAQTQDSAVVFCIDCSGTMEGDRLNMMRYMIDSQIDNLRKTRPNVRVCLVEFESNCRIYGDGSKPPVFVDSMLGYDEVVNVASANSVLKPIKESEEYLKKSVDSLTPRGSTAGLMGMLISVVIAKAYSNSSIIFCTDGQSNRGIEMNSNNINKVRKLAVDNKVSINVFSFEDCEPFTIQYEPMVKQCNGTYRSINKENVNSVVQGAIKAEKYGHDGKVYMVVPRYVEVVENSAQLSDIVKGINIPVKCRILSDELKQREFVRVQAMLYYTNMAGGQAVCVYQKEIPINNNIGEESVNKVVVCMLTEIKKFVLHNDSNSACAIIKTLEGYQFDVGESDETRLKDIFNTIQYFLQHKAELNNLDKILSAMLTLKPNDLTLN
ncbi:hypothetical protein EIN_173440 [Entamoeba invadens IP1]|uniref:VWFA domain-containing protein n=1 Tax=Entamoeba invadens IP1 TaxID=370355 RepID=A0A0A1TVX8_ENTIV|nr:hypothetical protein EIN_173440 [Entamoeba invadens IP1]ELP84669.1 hypothetical protein EIN_173440 [Entamoeba invadens IP1]|eukprot:XP_004184015.1 hypothetical protein EIN_173440 [Entamoeba invadens IP1]